MYLENVGWYVMICGTLRAPWLGTIPVRCSVLYSCDSRRSLRPSHIDKLSSSATIQHLPELILLL